jgi:para-nitrobenzyl esterase
MIVDLIEQGQVESVVDNGTTVFRGMPYAAPPTGANRWAPPQPAPTWPGTRKADTFGPACTQPTFDSMEGTEPIEAMSEDCLYLNVWTAETTVNPTANRPVMVWIHGGAFKLGESKSLVYNGSELAKKGAVVVSFNYRLGFLGFFNHRALENKTGNDNPMNFGLLDQIAALNWVKTNIASFGGNPNNVTIFGESAGAMSVLSLMASPIATGLFHKAIAQSPYAVPERSRDGARTLCEGVAREAWKLPDNIRADELRKVPLSVFELKEYPDGRPIPSLAPSAVYGDRAVPVKLRAAFAAQTQQAIPLMIGSNSNEQSIALAFDMDPVLIYNALEAMPDGPATIALLKLAYANDDLEDGAIEDKARFGGLIMRDLLFTMQVRSLANWQAKKGKDVFRYYFKYVPKAFRPDHPHGVDHGGEMVFPFNTGDIAFDTKGKFQADDYKIADAVSNYWFTFARDGKPTDTRLKVAWNAHTLHEPGGGDLTHIDRILVVDDELKLWVANFMIQRLNQYQDQYPTIEPLIEAILNGTAPGA